MMSFFHYKYNFSILFIIRYIELIIFFSFFPFPKFVDILSFEKF